MWAIVISTVGGAPGTKIRARQDQSLMNNSGVFIGGYLGGGLKNEFRREMIRDHSCRKFHHPLDDVRNEKANRSMLFSPS